MAKSNEELMVRWGIPAHYRNALWQPSEQIGGWIVDWVNNFPGNSLPGVLILSKAETHPMSLIAKLVNALLGEERIQTRVHVIDLPKLMISFSGTIDERVELVNRAQRAIVENDDLVVFEDLGVVKMSPENVNLAHSLINPMIKRSRPFIISSSANSEDFVENVGSGLYRLIKSSCQVIMI